MDGTPGGYYHQRAVDYRYRDFWVIHLQGGGECVDYKECSRRLSEPLGSSDFFPKSLNFTNDPAKESDGTGSKKLDERLSAKERLRRGAGGDSDHAVLSVWGRYGWWLLDANNQTNPEVALYNHVLIPYCSQDLYSGTRKDRTNWTNGEGVYFAGHLIVEAVLQELDFRGLREAKKVYLTGNSAGGMGMWLHVDWVAERYPRAKVIGVSIAGFYFYSTFYEGPSTNGLTLSDFSEAAWPNHIKTWQSFMDESCVQALKETPWACMLANYSLPYISSSTFIVEAQTDQTVLQDHNKVPLDLESWGPEVWMYIAEWHHNMTVALRAAVTLSPNKHAVFNPACFTHDNFTTGAPLMANLSFKEVLRNWLNPGLSGPTILVTETPSPPD